MIFVRWLVTASLTTLIALAFRSVGLNAFVELISGFRAPERMVKPSQTLNSPTFRLMRHLAAP